MNLWVGIWLMKVSKSIRDLYDELSNTATLIEKEVKEHLPTYCKSQKWTFSFRKKELLSFAQKLETGIYTSIVEIDDFFACEIIVPNLQQIEIAKKYISDHFEIISEKPDKLRPASEFSFDGIRIYVQIKPSVAEKNYSWMRFEIQIKTLLEKAWGEATHNFTYKCKEIHWSKERLVSQIKAILSHVDIMFSDIENISKTPALDKTCCRYEEINNISNWISNTWNDTECPSNMKRLSETILRLSKDYTLSFNEIKTTVERYQKENGMPTNLSIYGTILQALFDNENSAFLEKAKSDEVSYKRCKDLKLIIPEEVEIKEDIKKTLNKKRCIFLGSFSKNL